MTYNNNDYQPSSGKFLKSDNTLVNEADGYNIDGSQNEVVVGRTIPAVVTQVLNNIQLAASGAQNVQIDVTNINEIQLWISTTSTYSLSVYPKFTAVGDDSNLTTNSISLVTNVASPGTNRTNSYRLNQSTNAFSPAKTLRLLISNTDSVNPNTINLWIASRNA